MTSASCARIGRERRCHARKVTETATLGIRRQGSSLGPTPPLRQQGQVAEARQKEEDNPRPQAQEKVTEEYDIWGYGVPPVYKHWWTRAAATLAVLILLLVAWIWSRFR